MQGILSLLDLLNPEVPNVCEYHFGVCSDVGEAYFLLEEKVHAS